MNISIVIPNYNGEELLKKNLSKVLDSVKDYKNGKIEIIIPDDASKDNSVEIIAKFITSIKEKHIIGKTIHNDDRAKGGFSANVNRGAGLATGDILLLLNSDVIPKKGFLENLLKHFSDEKVFGVGCMDESVEDGKIVLRGRGIGKWHKGFLQHSAGKLDKTNTLWVSCGSAAFRKSLWNKLGGLQNMYNPFYWEDIDLSYRGQKSGYKVIFEKESVVTHEHSKGAILTNYKPEPVRIIAYRNQFFFVWFNITNVGFLMSHLFWLPYHLLNAIKGKDRAFLIGFWQAFRKLPQVLTVRAKNKKFFTVSDKQILQQFILE
jgi:GT2 family glycosyltransferase